MTRARTATLLAGAALLLAACGSGAGAAPQSWTPKPSFGGEGQVPGNPVPSASSTSPPRSQPSPNGNGSSKIDPAVVATKLTAPDAIAVLPDNTALVGERTTGRIVRVLPEAGQPVKTVRTITGIDTSGGGGLLDLALSPDFDEDSLVFALVTTAADMRVVEFTMTGPVTPVVTGIARPASGVDGRIAFGADGLLYIGTGSGTVQRVTEVGAAAGSSPGSAAFTRGHAPIAGLCLIANANVLLDVESAGSTVEVNVLTSGDDYGYPHPSSTSQGPIATLPSGQTSPGGCAVRDKVVYITSKDGRDILSAQLTQRAGAVSLSSFATLIRGRYGRLDTVVAAADGALWVTTSNKDGHGKAIADDERVLRILPGGGTATAPV